MQEKKRGSEVNYHISTRLLINPISLKAGVRHILLIQTPRDALIIKEIHQRPEFPWDAEEPVGPHAVCAATDGSDVVGLAGVGQGEEVAEGYALGGGPLKIRCLVALMPQIWDMNATYMGVRTND